MSKIIQKEVFTYGELSSESQEKAIINLSDINVGYEWWESIYEDAANIGCKISGFDTDRGNSINFKGEDYCIDIAKAIKKEHGEVCDTFILSMQYLIDYAKITADLLSINPDCDTDYSNEIEDLNTEFIRALGEEYLCILRKEYDYLTSDESIKETIIANDYYFTKEGKLTTQN